MVFADAEPEFTDDGDRVARNGQTALEHGNERRAARPVVFREATGGEDGPEIHRDLPGVIDANLIPFIHVFNLLQNIGCGVRGMR